MEWLILWVGLSFIAAIIAANKGRSGMGFFLLAILLSPLVGILAALVAKPNTISTEEQLIANGEARRCPFCAEMVRPEASVCKHCGRSLQTGAGSPTEEQWDRFVSTIEKRTAKPPADRTPPK